MKLLSDINPRDLSPRSTAARSFRLRVSHIWIKLLALSFYLSVTSLPLFAAPVADYPWYPPLGPDTVLIRPFIAPLNPYGPGHRGLDLANKTLANTVYAASAGTVHFVGKVGGKPTLSIDHADGLRTTYEPVVSTLQPGVSVVKGQAIGILDMNASSFSHCQPQLCLHFGLKQGDTYLDPLPLLALAPRIVLKPDYLSAELAPLPPPGTSWSPVLSADGTHSPGVDRAPDTSAGASEDFFHPSRQSALRYWFRREDGLVQMRSGVFPGLHGYISG